MPHSDLENEDNSKNDDSPKHEDDNKKKTTQNKQPSAMVNVTMHHFFAHISNIFYSEQIPQQSHILPKVFP